MRTLSLVSDSQHPNIRLLSKMDNLYWNFKLGDSVLGIMFWASLLNDRITLWANMDYSRWWSKQH